MAGKSGPFQLHFTWNHFQTCVCNAAQSTELFATREYSSAAVRASELTIPSGHECGWITRKHRHKQRSKHAVSRGQPLPELQHLAEFHVRILLCWRAAKQTENIMSRLLSLLCSFHILYVSMQEGQTKERETKEERIESVFELCPIPTRSSWKVNNPIFRFSAHSTANPSAQPRTTELYFPEISIHPDNNIHPTRIIPAHFISFLSTVVT